MRLRRTRLGSNQYRLRRRTYWKLYLFGYLGIVLAIILFAKYYQNIGMEKVYAEHIVSPLPIGNATPTHTPYKDVRAEKLYQYLQENESPLAQYADFIIDQADRNDIPWTLSVAISGKESSFGKAIKPGSHNAWGIMAWDSAGNRSIRVFNSWKESITFHASLIGKYYRADMNKGIQTRYCPSFECSNTWVENVTSFSEQINK